MSKKLKRPPPVILYLNFNQINRVQYYCYLGLSENMTWDKHVDHIVQRSSLSIICLQKISYYFDRRVKLAIYKTYIRPLLEYATLIFNANLSKSQAGVLENIQRRALFAYLGAYRHKSHSKLLHESWIEPLAIRRHYRYSWPCT